MLVRGSGPHVVQQLRAQVEELEAKIADLKEALGVDYEYEGLRRIGLTDNQAKLISVLLKRDIATASQLMAGAYIDAPSDVRYERVKRNIVVPLCQVRRGVLRRLGVSIENVKSYGWYLPPESKTRLRALMAAA